MWIIVLLEKANDNNFLQILKEFLLKDPYLERPYLSSESFRKSYNCFPKEVKTNKLTKIHKNTPQNMMQTVEVIYSKT